MNPAATAPPLAQAGRTSTWQSPEGEKEKSSGTDTPLQISHADYFKAVVPEPFRILGRKLLPLSIGRYRLMKRFNVAFVADEAVSADVGDLLLGVLICSMSCEAFVAFADSNDFEPEIERWARKIRARPPLFLRWEFSTNKFKKFIGILASCSFYGRWWRKHNSFNIVEKLSLFKRYIEEGSVVPAYWDESTGGKVSGVHWSQSVEVALRGKVGWSEAEINHAPLSKALNDYFKHMENEGLVRLMTDEERRSIEKPETPEDIAAMEEWLRTVELAKARPAGGAHVE